MTPEFKYTIDAAAKMLYEQDAEATKREQERILEIVKNELGLWYKDGYRYGTEEYVSGAKAALNTLKVLIREKK